MMDRYKNKNECTSQLENNCLELNMNPIYLNNIKKEG